MENYHGRTTTNDGAGTISVRVMRLSDGCVLLIRDEQSLYQRMKVFSTADAVPTVRALKRAVFEFLYELSARR